MILSRYFHDLHDSYQAEIEDLRYDSEGNDVLQARLREKRRELSAIMPLIEFDPILVATVFHGAFDFEPANVALFEELLAREPGEFLPWLETAAGVGIAEWAEPMIEEALSQEQGQDFISTVLGLEYALSRYHDPYRRDAQGEGESEEGGDGEGGDGERGRGGRGDGERDDDGEGHPDDMRIDEFLEQQGFDRRSES